MTEFRRVLFRSRFQAVQKLSEMSTDELADIGACGKEYILKNYEYGVLSKKFLDVFKLPKKEK